ncbi:hypothetical protein [Flectobacillus major]|uniref:hypothetical protein n=1 Tax=Flectobacillus major TaxID=103 RepID=UPI00041B71C3|nr:hypothetical protein [Flectobacillus major]
MTPTLKLKNLLTLFLFFCFVVINYHFAYNFFYADDYHLIRYVTDQQDAQGFLNQWNLLFDLHNEHRIIFPRLFTLLHYWLNGNSINWQIFNSISLLYYLGICWLFYQFFTQLKLSYWYFLPIPFLLFQPQAYENIYWTISVLQQVGNLFWAMLLFWLICTQKPQHFIWAFIIAFVLTFTHGNGLFGIFVAGVILLLQKRYKQLYIWVAYMLLLFVLYFVTYKAGQNSNIKGSLSNPIQLFRCMFAFWGSFVWETIKSSFTNNISAVLTGMVLVGTMAFVNIRFVLQKLFPIKYQIADRQVFLMACFLYLLITSLLVALSRSWIGGDSGMDIRYMHNSIWATVLWYLTVLSNTKAPLQKYLMGSFVIFGIGFNLLSWYNHVDRLEYQYQANRAEAFNYRNYGTIVRETIAFNRNIEKTLQASFQKGVSQYTDRDLDRILQSNAITITQDTLLLQIKQQVQYLQDPKNPHRMDSYYIDNNTLPYSKDALFVLKSNTRTLLVPMLFKRTSKGQFIRTWQYFDKGFITSFITESIPSDNYQLGILTQKNDKYHLHLLKNSIAI